MSYVPEGNCTAALQYARFVPLYGVHWAQALLSLATFMLCLLNVPPLASALRSWHRQKSSTIVTISTGTAPKPVARNNKISFHLNVKILLVGALIIYMVHSMVMFSMHFGYVVLFHLPTLDDACLYEISTWKCLLLRVPSYVAVAGFTFAHLAFCIERAVATWHVQCYEQFTAKLGIFLLLPMFLVPLGWNLWIFHEEDFLTNKAYCMSTSAKNSSRLLGMSYILIGLDLFAIFTDIVLYAVNRYQQKKKTEGYSLRKSFQLHENDLSIRLILPLCISHSLMFTCFLTVYSALKTTFINADELIFATAVESAHVIETLYTLVSVGLFLVLRRRLASKMQRLSMEIHLKKSQQAKLYAAQYQKYW